MQSRFYGTIDFYDLDFIEIRSGVMTCECIRFFIKSRTSPGRRGDFARYVSKPLILKCMAANLLDDGSATSQKLMPIELIDLIGNRSYASIFDNLVTKQADSPPLVKR